MRHLSADCRSDWFLDLAQMELLQNEAFIEGLALTAADLAQGVFLERDLGVVDPIALRGPIEVAGRNLRLRHESDASVAEIRKTHAIPSRLRRRRLPP